MLSIALRALLVLTFGWESRPAVVTSLTLHPVRPKPLPRTQVKIRGDGSPNWQNHSPAIRWNATFEKSLRWLIEAITRGTSRSSIQQRARGDSNTQPPDP